MIKLFKLPYKYSALEPHIGRNTMNIHYNCHYKGYYDKFTKRIKEMGIEEKNPLKIYKKYKSDKSIRDNGGGYINHSRFWKMLAPQKTKNNLPYSISKQVIKQDFGSYEEFKKQIKEQAKKRFGSGWVWWVGMPDGSTKIINTPYQDVPENVVLLGLDVWEHAYYLDYNCKREDYVDNFFKVINWDNVNKTLMKSI